MVEGQFAAEYSPPLFFWQLDGAHYLRDDITHCLEALVRNHHGARQICNISLGSDDDSYATDHPADRCYISVSTLSFQLSDSLSRISLASFSAASREGVGMP